MASLTASHFSKLMTGACIKNDVAFVCSVQNAMHLLQHLDVGIFRPAKKCGEVSLLIRQQSACIKHSIPKSIILKLVKLLCNELNDKYSNVILGFRTCGLIPLDSNQVLKPLPSNIQQAVEMFLVNLLLIS